MHLWQRYSEVKAGILLYFYGSYEVRFPELPIALSLGDKSAPASISSC